MSNQNHTRGSSEVGTHIAPHAPHAPHACSVGFASMVQAKPHIRSKDNLELMGFLESILQSAPHVILR